MLNTLLLLLFFSGTSVKKNHIVSILSFHIFVVHIVNDSFQRNLTRDMLATRTLSILKFKIFYDGKENVTTENEKPICIFNSVRNEIKDILNFEGKHSRCKNNTRKRIHIYCHAKLLLQLNFSTSKRKRK